MSKSVIYKEAAFLISRIVSLEIVAPLCGEEGTAMDKPPWCSKTTGHLYTAIACNNSRKSRRNLSF